MTKLPPTNLDKLKALKAPANTGRTKTENRALPRSPKELFFEATSQIRRKPESLLFCREDSIGDILIFASVLDEIRRAWTGVKIAMVLRESLKSIAQVLPEGVTYFFTSAEPFSTTVRNFDAKSQIESFVREFAPEVFVAPCFNKTWLTYLIATSVSNCRTVSLGEPVCDEQTRTFLNERGLSSDTLFSEVIRVGAQTSEAEKNQILATYLLDRPVNPKPYRARISSASDSAAEEVLNELHLRSNEFVLCNPAGNSNTRLKSWSADNFAAAIEQVTRRFRVPVLLIGSENEENELSVVLNKIPEGLPVKKWCGTPGSFGTYAAIASKARLYLGNDTSTLHLCDGFGIPSVTIFGGGTWPRFKGQSKNATAIVAPLPCFGCNWDCAFEEPFCISLVQVKDVVAAVARYFENAKAIPVVELRNHDLAIDQVLGKAAAKYRLIRIDSAKRYEQIVELTSLAERREREVAELNQAARRLRSELERTSTEAEVLRQTLSKNPTKEQFDEIVSDLGRLNDQKIVVETQLQSLGGTLQEKTGEAERLGRDLKTKTEEVAALRQQIETLSHLENSNNNVVEDLKRQLSLLTEERTNLSHQVNVVAGHDAALRTDVEKLQSQLELERSERIRAEAELNQERKLRTEMTEQVRLRQAEIEDLNRQLQEVAGKIESARSEIAQGKAREADLTGQLESLGRQLTAVLSERDVSQTSLMAEREIEDQLRKEVSALKSQLADKNEELQQSRQKEAQLHSQLRDQVLANTELVAQVGACDDELAAARTTREHERKEAARIAAELASREQSLTELHARLSECEAVLRRQFEERPALENLLANKTVELTRAEGLLARHMEEIRTLRSAATTLDETVASLQTSLGHQNQKATEAENKMVWLTSQVSELEAATRELKHSLQVKSDIVALFLKDLPARTGVHPLEADAVMGIEEAMGIYNKLLQNWDSMALQNQRCNEENILLLRRTLRLEETLRDAHLEQELTLKALLKSRLDLDLTSGLLATPLKLPGETGPSADRLILTIDKVQITNQFTLVAGWVGDLEAAFKPEELLFEVHQDGQRMLVRSLSTVRRDVFEHFKASHPSATWLANSGFVLRLKGMKIGPFRIRAIAAATSTMPERASAEFELTGDKA